ncbi:hypothetical protein BC938DRAFT_473777 [Jimgerdemannia flammicorona]|uniref:Uncharacterized protein n=1 Tax=Jimgerdemannia flammicorona TaxID=994334 RepID=A0A433Q3E9_9FUNG|nr:hypothetical protein BC938DRAFT_473777 [Jimgerdemannia flammicorona]
MDSAPRKACQYEQSVQPTERVSVGCPYCHQNFTGEITRVRTNLFQHMQTCPHKEGKKCRLCMEVALCLLQQT